MNENKAAKKKKHEQDEKKVRGALISAFVLVSIWWALLVGGEKPYAPTALVRDLSLLPFAGLVTAGAFLLNIQQYSLRDVVIMDIKSRETETSYEEQNVTIVMLHGSSFNWIEWLPMMHSLPSLLKKKPHQWRSSLSVTYHIDIVAFNYAEGWLSGNDNTSIEAYSEHAFARLYSLIQLSVSSFSVSSSSSPPPPPLRMILVGHSMGGLVADYMAHYLLSSHKNIRVVGVVTICTPWRGTPTIARLVALPWYLGGGDHGKQRYHQMSPNSLFLQNATGIRTQPERSYPIATAASVDDLFVPGEYGHLPEDMQRLHYAYRTTTPEQLAGNGHYSTIVSPGTFE